MRKIFFLSLILVSLLSIKTNSQIMFTAALTGAQETPPVTTTGAGTAWAVLNSDMKSITFSITYARLSAPFTAAHFHVGAAGNAGGVVFPLTFTGNTARGTWNNIPDSILVKLFNGLLYVNVHTSANPGGEIRGQFVNAGGIGFTSSIDGSQENPPVNTTGTGTGYLVIENNGAQLSYRFTIAALSSNFTASHFHYSPTGINGPVLQAIDFGSDSTTSGSVSGFPDSILVQLLKKNIYMNVHTTNNAGGEIRGQLIHQGEVLFTANLNGNQEVPPVSTLGRGTGWAILRNDNTSIYYRETFARLSAAFTAGHIHIGAPGTNGQVIKPFTFNGNSAEGTYTGIPDSLIVQFIKGNTYMNVHSAAHGGGEIRGQLNYTTGIGFVTALDGLQEVPQVTTGGQGTGYFIWNSSLGNSLSYQLTIAALGSQFTASHFHSGAPGVGGPVVQPIDFLGDSTVISSWAALSDANVLNLANNNLYTNVHTNNNPGGEIRGQVVFTNALSGNLVSVDETTPTVPAGYSLSQNYPNPFNPSTIISYSIPVVSNVKLTVYNILGKQIEVLENQIKGAGTYKISWAPKNLASGVYFYRLEAGNFVSTKKLLFLK